MRLSLIAASIVVGMVPACAPRLPLPMTAAELVRHDSGPALVVYLGQPDASPTVCDLRAPGPHVSAFTPEIRGRLIDGFVDGRIDTAPWRRCIEVALDGLPAAQVPSVFDDLMLAYRKLLKDSAIETDPARAERVATIQRLYLDRRPGLDGHPEVLAAIFDDLRTLLAKDALGAVARTFAAEVLATVDVEHGTWQGRRVDLAMMDALAATGNEMTLTRFAERLPEPDLREQAKRRIVRLHIALSAFDEVRTAAAAVEEAVMREGNNPVVLADHRLVRAWFDDSKETIRSVRVRQRVWQHAATLLGYTQQRPTLSVLPELAFRGRLWAELQSISHPVTLCGSRRAIDPTPCIAISSVSLDNPFTYLDEAGRFHFRDDVGEKEVVPLAARDAFTLPVAIDGQPAASLRWGLSYERPEDLELRGPGEGGRGPDLDVRVDHPNPSRYVFTVHSPLGEHVAVVEAADLAAFHVASRGTNGATGWAGSAGSTGTSGSACSNGGPGGNGGDGNNGGDGGHGGDAKVVIVCGLGPCDVDLLERIIFSAGGDGGQGGPGGPGGPGGSGGDGRPASTHTDGDGNPIVDDPGCAPGSPGFAGSSGVDGWPGHAGSPGRVTFEVVR